MLAILSIAELLGMSVWFAGTAIAPALAARWSLDAGAAGWLSTAVQLGFVVGTALAALLNLADTMPARTYVAVAATLAGVLNALLLIAPGYDSALALRFAAGMTMAGIYPPAMKMISTWFVHGRGIAIGTIVGALTAGKALPYLLRALPNASPDSVVIGASVAAWLAAAIVLIAYRDGPVPFPRRAFSWGLAATVLRTAEYRRVLGGYLGHMWELYSYWVWIPAYLAAALAHRGTSSSAISVLAFLAIAVGAIGCVWGGALADRIGHARLVILAMAVSGACALLTPFAFGGPVIVLVGLILVWGVTVVADSAQFSTLVTRVVPQHAVGTALTLQTSLGFLLTTVSIQIVPPIEAALGWRWAFPALALGPLLGILVMRPMARASRVRAAPPLSTV